MSGVEGMCMELMKLIEADSNGTFEYSKDFVRGVRFIKNLEDGLADFRTGLSKNPDRENALLFTGHASKVANIVIARKDENAIISDIADLKNMGHKGTILTVLGAASANILRSEGFTIDEDGKTVESNLEKMLAGRAK